MKKNIFCLVLLLFCRTELKAQDSLTYALVNDILKSDVGTDTSFYLIDSTYNYDFSQNNEEKTSIENNTKKYVSNIELLKMFSEISHPFKWDTKKINNVESVIKNIDSRYDSSLIQGKSVCLIGIPVFDSTKQYAIINIYDLFVGEWGGSDCVYFCKLEKNVWTIVVPDCIDY